MILFHAVSIYQILICMLLRKNKFREKQAICVLPDFIVQKLPGYKELERKQIFNKVLLYPYEKLRQYPYNMETIGRIGDELYKENISIPLESYEEIFCAATHFAFASYLVSKGIRFNYIEDAAGVFLEIDRFREGQKLIDSAMYTVTERNGLYDGRSACIKKIYADVPSYLALTEHRIVRCNVMDELDKLPQDEFECIKAFFGIENVNIPSPALSVLFLASSAATLGLLTIEEQIKINILTIDYFSQQSNLVLKPHPNDMLYYKSIFPDAVVLPRVFPLELLKDFMLRTDAHIIAIGSTITKNMGTADVIEFDDDYLLGGFNKLHQYWGIKEIYLSLMENAEYDFFLIGDKQCIFSNWRIKVFRLDELTKRNRTSFVVIGQEEIDFETIASLLRDQNAIVVLDEAYEYLPDIVHETSCNIASKKVKISTDSWGVPKYENIYILSMEESVLECVNKLCNKKHLKYMDGEVVMEPLTEKDMEIAVLEGILEATERRLKRVLKENMELKEAKR